eukprot:g26668.t1
MATIAGYKAVLMAADTLPRMFPMLMTAAGTITPARVFIVGAGVAGLQAIATARRLGAVVQSYDVRPDVKEQVESLGARFVELDLAADDAEGKGGYAKEMDEEFYRKQREKMAEVVAQSEVVITTAAIPGRASPLLITADAVAGMSAGSVIVDLAAERGGNCELTKADETVVTNGVTIFGPTNLPATIPFHASEMYSRNIATFLMSLVKDNALSIDLSDEVLKETRVTGEGEIANDRVRSVLGLDPIEPEEPEKNGPAPEPDTAAGDEAATGDTPSFINMQFTTELRDLAYLVAAALFIFGLKGLTHPRTAVRGNLLGALGMLVAVVVTLLGLDFDPTLIVIGLVVGTIIGGVMAVAIQMTAMPQLVALFNGFGGVASVLVAGAFISSVSSDDLLTIGTDVLAATAASGLIGAVTFTGSLVAFGKLQELKWLKDIRFSGQQAVNLLLLAASIALSVMLTIQPEQAVMYYWAMSAIALALGVLLVISIGGADMPVVIALLNSYSGLAAAATGFVLSNNVLIIAGSLVGASGLILTRIMCVAMNRSLAAVLFGSMQAGAEGPSADEVYRTVKSASADEVAMLLETARRVCIIPGYGMAVAQAQHAVRDLTNLLTSAGVQVEFGIHPVAGRMPGHMNVLLAEADIPYEMLKEMGEINSEMDQVDIAIVLGANDVVNPVARTDPSSPIAGMPIIDVDKARTVVVIKRSLSPGFAGIPNPLFAAENSLMLFGDGKKAVVEIVKAIQEG